MVGNSRFGIAWGMFAAALALHVTDEATHDFLASYNPSVLAIRARLPFLPLPTFTFGVWLGSLIAGICLLLCLSPLAFRGIRWLRIAAWPVGLLFGIANASLHIGSSIYFHRWMPGVYSSPVLLIGGVYLLVAARKSSATLDS